jgi:hypothetical protein
MWRPHQLSDHQGPARAAIALLSVLVLTSTLVACGSEADMLNAGSTTSTTTSEVEVAMVPPCSDLETVPEPDGPLSSDPAVAKQQQARATMGLRSDEAWTRSVMDRTADDPVPPGSPSAAPIMTNVNGAAITPHESLTIVLAQDPVTGSVLSQYGDRFPDSFGGVWIDNTTHSFVIAFTRDVEAHRTEIQSLTATPANLPSGIDPARTPTTSIADVVNPVRVVQVEHTEAELKALIDRIAPAMQTPAGAPEITSVGERTNLNAASVGLIEVTDEGRAWLAARFGSSGLCVEKMGRATTAAG